MIMRSLVCGACLFAAPALAEQPKVPKEWYAGRNEAGKRCVRGPFLQALRGELPSGSPKREMTQAQFDIILSTISDPAVPDNEVNSRIMKRMLEADPSLASKPRPGLSKPRPFIGARTKPATVTVNGMKLVFRCEVRQYGQGWHPFKITIAREGSKQNVGVPLITKPEAWGEAGD